MIATEDRVVSRLRALAHPTRLAIVHRLAAEPEVCACDFVDVFGVSQPTISEHLRVLRECGLVRTRRQGNQICYSVVAEAVAEVLADLSQLRACDEPVVR